MNKEIIRLSVKEKSANCGQVASRVLRSLLKDQTEQVSVQFVNEGEKKDELYLKFATICRIMERMLTYDSLDKIFGGEVPEEFKGVRVVVKTSLPHQRKVMVNHDPNNLMQIVRYDFSYELVPLND